MSQAYTELLARVRIFADLAPEALERLADICVEESHPAGTLLFQHGDAGDKLYLILSGRVRISREVPGMGEEALAILGQGDVFGEMSLFDDGPRSADAHIHERCRLLAIPKDRFAELLRTNRDLAHDILWATVRILAHRLRQTNDKLTFLSISAKF